MAQNFRIIRKYLLNLKAIFKTHSGSWHPLIKHNVGRILNNSLDKLTLAGIAQDKGETEKASKKLREIGYNVNVFKRVMRNPQLTQVKEVELHGFFRNAIMDLKKTNSDTRVPIVHVIDPALKGFSFPLVSVGIEECLRVFVDNATRATKLSKNPKAPITITVSKEGKLAVVVKVIDKGTGFSEEVGKKLFTERYTTKNEAGEHGVGLRAANAVIKGMHGGVAFCSSVEGKGAEFGFRIPLKHEPVLT